MTGPSISAQLNLHPNDVDFIAHTLPHQIRTWSPQVDRIHVTIDTHGVSSGHYGARNLKEKLARLRTVLRDIARTTPSLVVDEVDYSTQARSRVARYWFDADDMPIKAWNGSPFYAYLFGLSATQADYIVHFDGDMLFGGGSASWMAEAIERLRSDPGCAFVCPHPGPPREDGQLIGHRHIRPVGGTPFSPIEREGDERSYRFSFVSTRIFATGVREMRERLGQHLRLVEPNAKERLYARLINAPSHTIELERLLSRAMTDAGCTRIDMLGREPGMWSLHPLDRGETFVAALPGLIEAAESDALPPEQRGRYNVSVSRQAPRRIPLRLRRWTRYGMNFLERKLSRSPH